MAFVLKLYLGSDLRRARLSSAADVTIDKIKALVRENFGLDSFIAMYLDEEGEARPLTTWTLEDAVRLAGSTLRLEIAVPEDETTDCSASWVVANSDWGGAASGSRTPLCVEGVELEEAAAPAALGVPSFAIHTPCPGSPRTAAAAPVDSTEVQSEGSAEEAVPPESEWTMEQPQEAPPAATAAAAPVDAAESQEASAPPTPRAAAAPATAEEEEEEEDAQPPPPQHPEEKPAEAEPQAAAADGTSAFRSMSDLDKVSIVLAAFDADGDGRLNYQESNELQRAAAGDPEMELAYETFAGICEQFGLPPERGLGIEELSELYDRYDTLDRDFAASVVRLQMEGAMTGEAPAARPSAPEQEQQPPTRPATFRPCEHIVPLLLLGGLSLRAPLIGLPIAVLAARRWRQ